ncbi:MAG: hypothetical protein WAS73_07760 [Defluviicoccus sp.]
MEITLDRVLHSEVRRHSPAPTMPLREATPAAPVSVQSAAAVIAVNQADKSAPAAKNQDREGTRGRRQEPTPEPVAAGGRYARQLVYERDLERTFLDVVDRDDEDKLLMRIPPEKLVRFLANHGERQTPPAAPAPQLDLVA